MSALRYDYYVYLNNIGDTPKRFREIYIRKSSPDINMMPPNFLLRKSLIKSPRIYVEK